MWAIHTHEGIVFSLKKEGNPAVFHNADDAGGRVLSEKKPVSAA